MVTKIRVCYLLIPNIKWINSRMRTTYFIITQAQITRIFTISDIQIIAHKNTIEIKHNV